MTQISVETLTKWAKAIAAVAVLVVGTIGYMHVAIDEAVASEAQVREEGDLRTRLQIIAVRLSFLNTKKEKTPDEDFEIKTLRDERTIYITRLSLLESK